MNNTILALDLATKTGWACNQPYETGKPTIISGVQIFDVKRGESPGMRFLRCRGWLNEINDLVMPDVIAYEQAHHRGGAATACGVGLVTVVLEFAAQHKIEITSVHSATLKKWATGSGRASKDQMIEAVIRKGHQPQDDNEADALLLLYYTIESLGV